MVLLPMLAVASLETTPDWIERPSGVDIARAYPRKAMGEGLVGRAVLGCKVAANGRMKDCVVSDVEPVGEGFDQATLSLSNKFRVRPRTKAGEPVEDGSVRIPIRFVLPGTVTLPVIVVRRTGVVPTQVSIDCRVNLVGRLDNCITGHQDLAARQVALEVVAEANAKPNPQPRASVIRVNIPIEIKLPEPR